MNFFNAVIDHWCVLDRSRLLLPRYSLFIYCTQNDLPRELRTGAASPISDSVPYWFMMSFFILNKKETFYKICKLPVSFIPTLFIFNNSTES